MKGLPKRKRAAADAKKRNVPKVGLFFVVNGKPCVEGIPWNEIPSVAGFRTYAVGHPEYWVQLQQLGLALGTSGRVSPWLAAWFPNLSFGLVGLWMTTRIR